MCPAAPRETTALPPPHHNLIRTYANLITPQIRTLHFINRGIIYTASSLASYIIKHYYKHITSYFLTPGDEGEGRQRRSSVSRLVIRQDQVIDLIGHVLLYHLYTLFAKKYHFSQLNNQNCNFIYLLNYTLS